MSTLVILLRVAALLAFAGPALLVIGKSRGEVAPSTARNRGRRAPVVANIAAFGLFFALLPFASGSSQGPMARPLALSGCVLALAGAALVLRSRVELGDAWSFVPRAGQETGLITIGPYGLVRHPIYLGLSLLAGGDALAFGNLPAAMVVLAAIVPTLAWRARAEEILLGRVFGERYDHYRKQTRMIIPYLL